MGAVIFGTGGTTGCGEFAGTADVTVVHVDWDEVRDAAEGGRWEELLAPLEQLLAVDPHGDVEVAEIRRKYVQDLLAVIDRQETVALPAGRRLHAEAP